MEPVEYQAMYEQEQHFWWYRALHDIMVDRLQHMHLSPGTALLDAGCGTGGLLKRLRTCFPAFQLTGLEFHPSAIQHLESLIGVTVVNGDVNHLPFADNHFDVIVLNDVLYHRNIDPVRCLAGCRNALKPGGNLLVNVPAYDWMMSAHDRQVHTRERYTAGKLRKQLADAGFTVGHTGYWNSLLFPVMALHRLTAGKMKSGSDVETLPAWLDNLFFRIIHCEQFLQRHHIHLPFGGSVWARATKP